MKKIFEELGNLWSSIDEANLQLLAKQIAETEGNIFCLGAGRMGYAIQSFAMRLSHLGYKSFMIGDTILPRVCDNDVVIVNSSSGETPSIVLLAKLAKENGGKIIVFTSNKHSTLGKLADFCICYSEIKSEQLMKTAYEQFTFVLFDHLAQIIYEVSGKDRSWVENNHSILE